MGYLKKGRENRAPAALALLAVFILLAACGPSVIQGRPPFVGISGMSLKDDRLGADFRIANQNGVPMTIQAYELRLSVENEDLLRESREYSLPIDSNSAEPLVVQQVPGAAAERLLLSLERGERASLPFELSGRVRTVEDGYLRFELKGHLYPVPGKPGHYRSAVIQAKDLRRDEDI